MPRNFFGLLLTTKQTSAMWEVPGRAASVAKLMVVFPATVPGGEVQRTVGAGFFVTRVVTGPDSVRPEASVTAIETA